jgi:hypothetical protein
VIDSIAASSLLVSNKELPPRPPISTQFVPDGLWLVPQRKRPDS